MEWIVANYAVLKQIWILWFLLLFVGIVAWAFRPANRERFEARGRIPLDDDHDATGVR